MIIALLDKVFYCFSENVEKTEVKEPPKVINLQLYLVNNDYVQCNVNILDVLYSMYQKKVYTVKDERLYTGK